MNWLTRQVDLHPDEVAVRFERSEVTWAKLAQRTNRVAAALQLAGVRPGARVATLVDNGIDFVALLHAAMWTGTTLVPLDTRHPDPMLSDHLRECAADLLVIDHGAANRSLELGHVRFVQIEELTYSVSSPPVALRPESEGTIVYTSGRRASARPVRLTWRNHEASAIGSGLSLGIDRADQWLCCLPMSRIEGMGMALRAAVHGSALRVMERFDAEQVIAALTDGATLLSLWPEMLLALLDSAGGVDELARLVSQTKVRAILLEGRGHAKEVIADGLMAGLPLCQTYSLTETASHVAVVPPGRSADKIGSAGFPVWGAEISIRDAYGEPVTEGEGVVYVRGAMVTSGYLDRPDLNRRLLVGGWFRTDDVGRLDDEGFLWLS